MPRKWRLDEDFFDKLLGPVGRPIGGGFFGFLHHYNKRCKKLLRDLDESPKNRPTSL